MSTIRFEDRKEEYFVLFRQAYQQFAGSLPDDSSSLESHWETWSHGDLGTLNTQIDGHVTEALGLPLMAVLRAYFVYRGFGDEAISSAFAVAHDFMRSNHSDFENRAPEQIINFWTNVLKRTPHPQSYLSVGHDLCAEIDSFRGFEESMFVLAEPVVDENREKLNVCREKLEEYINHLNRVLVRATLSKRSRFWNATGAWATGDHHVLEGKSPVTAAQKLNGRFSVLSEDTQRSILKRILIGNLLDEVCSILNKGGTVSQNDCDELLKKINEAAAVPPLPEALVDSEPRYVPDYGDDSDLSTLGVSESVDGNIIKQFDNSCRNQLRDLLGGETLYNVISHRVGILEARGQGLLDEVRETLQGPGAAAQQIVPGRQLG